MKPYTLAHTDVTLSEDILQRLPPDAQEANVLVNEILRQALAVQNESSNQKLENRPDWQALVAIGRDERKAGRVISHDEVMQWHLQHQ